MKENTRKNKRIWKRTSLWRSNENVYSWPRPPWLATAHRKTALISWLGGSRANLWIEAKRTVNMTAEHNRDCVICGNNTPSLHLLPKKEELRTKWLEFIFGTPPANYSPNLVLCSSHFKHSDFHNLGAYSSGFAAKLLLKPGSVPSQRSSPSTQGVSKNKLFYLRCLLLNSMFIFFTLACMEWARARLSLIENNPPNVTERFSLLNL